MPLSWITDEALLKAKDRLMDSARKAVEEADTRQVKNIVDPFLTLLKAKTFDISKQNELEKIQCMESGLRGLSNHVGVFHQQILGSVRGWRNHDAGYDLESEEKKIVAEIKNKHNTMNQSNRNQVIADVATAIRQKGRGWCGYIVIVIPKNAERFRREAGKTNVFEIDGASFYHEVTGEPNAIHDLFDYLADEIAPSADIAAYCRSVMESSLPARE